jgi:lysophospholipase L1-like esterase
VRHATHAGVVDEGLHRRGVRSKTAPSEALLHTPLGRTYTMFEHVACSSRRAQALGRRAAALVVAAASMLASTAAFALGDRSMLALGDSVVFGYIADAGYAYTNADNFVGYPAYVGGDLRLDVVNASCPGETTSGFISLAGADNGCRPYRANYPLHVAYATSQLDFATSYLATHRQTKLVTVSLGANDGFLLQNACGGDPACIQAGLPAVLNAIHANMNTILGNLRATGFRGVLMVVNYYSLDYSDPDQTALSQALNRVLALAAAANRAVVADAFGAFQAAASTPFAGGKTCKAGLLNASAKDQFVCDVHPSQSGQQLLARTVEAAFAAASR